MFLSWQTTMHLITDIISHNAKLIHREDAIFWLQHCEHKDKYPNMATVHETMSSHRQQ
jgi:hypothetical protein